MTPAILTVFPQALALIILAGAVALFLQNRIRYDIVAILIMLAIIASGVLGYEEVFANFGHPAIIIIAAMFVISEAFIRSGIIDALTRRMTWFYTRPMIGLALLIIFVTFLSAFINNAGALAITIPIAIYLAKKSNKSIALFLLPLAFASHLGGFTTLIGTPRNILISDFRIDAIGSPFAMFDFFYVGGAVALIGVIFLIFISWRLIPVKQRENNNDNDILRFFTTEVSVPNDSDLIGLDVHEVEARSHHNLKVVAVYRHATMLADINQTQIMANDHLILKGELEALTDQTSLLNLNLVGLRAKERFVTNEDDYATIEVMVPTYSKIIGRTWDSIPLPKRFGTNFISLYRREGRLETPLASTTFWPNDVLLLQGRIDSIESTIESMQLLQIDRQEEVILGRDTSIFTTLAVSTTAILIATFNIIPLPVIFLVAAVLLILLKTITLRQAYESIDQTVLILLAGMITLGDALLKSGAAKALATGLLSIHTFVGPMIMLLIVLIIAMLLADFMNATAAAVVTAPIAILVAQSMQVSVDPFLMAVAIGSSCAFLTPIGHESNTIVMRPGGYTFNDYTRVGLPLEIIIVITTIPMIMYFWPFYV
ncbi:MAG: SLC13 family permease [Candidatus Nomurabacteria bacterium]|nr:MAG: SLC13 family permease [Candidatus Nomurabacteria bacterium]